MKFCIWVSAEIKPDFVSRMIMWWLKCDYSHIGIGLVDQDNELHTIYHSVGEGFSTLSVKDFLSHGKKIVGVKHIPVKNPDQALGFLDGMMGKDYSEMQYIGFMLPWLKKLVDNGEGELVCSEAATLFVQKYMVDGEIKFKDFNADFTSPKDLWEAI